MTAILIHAERMKYAEAEKLLETHLNYKLDTRLAELGGDLIYHVDNGI